MAGVVVNDRQIALASEPGYSEAIAPRCGCVKATFILYRKLNVIRNVVSRGVGQTSSGLGEMIPKSYAFWHAIGQHIEVIQHRPRSSRAKTKGDRGREATLEDGEGRCWWQREVMLRNRCGCAAGRFGGGSGNEQLLDLAAFWMQFEKRRGCALC
ncbi:hypothetical protein CVT26_004852 [Gymnopilus dilepis]|uniref:Uncharacterized protein n=1 Tax=Gymnopilus dilepis TaxID=231916 RepID=A0A409YTR0_9AGAR|nr:hypothetical protein CVT26_004852 [Gymnopilus dilepis]